MYGAWNARASVATPGDVYGGMAGGFGTLGLVSPGGAALVGSPTPNLEQRLVDAASTHRLIVGVLVAGLALYELHRVSR